MKFPVFLASISLITFSASTYVGGVNTVLASDLDHIAAISDSPLFEDDLTSPIPDADGDTPDNPDWNPTYTQIPVTEDDLTKPVPDADGNAPDHPDWTATYEQKPVMGGGTVEETAVQIKDTIEQTESNTESIAQTVQRIETAFDRLDTNEIEISKNAAAINANTNAIANNSSRIDALEDDVEELKSGVAMAIAIANAPIVTNGKNKFSLSGGIGYYEEQFGLAVKGAFMPTDSVAITASVASDLEDNFAVGAGVGFGF